jgi:hypothetical protein
LTATYASPASAGDREKATSPPEIQREAIEKYAANLDGEIVAWHQDED